LPGTKTHFSIFLLFYLRREYTSKREKFMKQRLVFGLPGIVLLIFGIMLTGCPQTEDPLSSNAELSGITIAGVSATLGTPSTEWNKVVDGNVYLTAAQLADAEVAAAKADSGAIVYYALAPSDITMPNFVEESTFDLEYDFDSVYDNYLYVEVFSANHDALLFYRVRVHLIQPALEGVTVAGKAASSIGTPGGTYDAAVAGEIIVGSSKLNTAQPVSVTSILDSTSLRYAKVTGSGAPVFADTASVTVANNDFIYIEATAEDGSTKLIYKLQVVEKDDNTNVSAVTLGGTAVTTIGTPAASVAAVTAGETVRLGSAGALNSFTVSATASGTNATLKYGTAVLVPGFFGPPAVTPTWAEGTSLGTRSSGDYIIIEVTSEEGTQGYYLYRIAYGSSEAAITGATVGGATANLGAPQAVFSNVGAGTVTLTAAQAGSDAVVAAGGASANATVEYGVGSVLDFGGGFLWPIEPTVWTDGSGLFNGSEATPWGPAVPPGVADGALITIRVTSEDKTVINYYVITATVSE
jgi:hypothetical protein